MTHTDPFSQPLTPAPALGGLESLLEESESQAAEEKRFRQAQREEAATVRRQAREAWAREQAEARKSELPPSTSKAPLPTLASEWTTVGLARLFSTLECRHCGVTFSTFEGLMEVQERKDYARAQRLRPLAGTIPRGLRAEERELGRTMVVCKDCATPEGQGLTGISEVSAEEKGAVAGIGQFSQSGRIDSGLLFFYGLCVVITLLLVPIFAMIWKDFTSPKIELTKANWYCSQEVPETYYQPSKVGPVMTLIPMTTNVCVQYSKGKPE